MIYRSDTRPLPADVGLRFERAEMQIIRWMYVWRYHNTERLVKN